MCFFISLLAFGPRVVAVLWWLIAPGRWDTAFSTALWPILGIVALPWTTITWVSVAPLGNTSGYDWLWIGLAVFADLASYASSGYGGRNKVPGYA